MTKKPGRPKSDDTLSNADYCARYRSRDADKGFKRVFVRLSSDEHNKLMKDVEKRSITVSEHLRDLIKHHDS